MNAKYSINSCDGLGVLNSVCTATKHSFYVPELASLLSIKAVLSGRVVLTIDGRKLMAREGSFVVVNDRQRFALTIESRELTTMFCIFFARGFVEDIWRSTVTPTSELLDDSRPDPRHTRFFGKTPHHFLSDYRLERAAAELRLTERSVTELSSDCGFESLPSFSNLFQRRYGMSPREYRRTWARNSKIRKIG